MNHEVRSSRPARQRWRNPVSTKNTKISWAWWWVLVISAIREAEAENSLNLGGEGCSEPRSCHHTPAWATEQDCLKKKKVRTGGGEMERNIRKGSNVAMATPPVPPCRLVSSPWVGTCPHGPHTPVARPFCKIENPVQMTTGSE